MSHVYKEHSMSYIQGSTRKQALHFPELIDE